MSRIHLGCPPSSCPVVVTSPYSWASGLIGGGGGGGSQIWYECWDLKTGLTSFGDNKTSFGNKKSKMAINFKKSYKFFTKMWQNMTSEVRANQPILAWLGWGWLEQYIIQSRATRFSTVHYTVQYKPGAASIWPCWQVLNSQGRRRGALTVGPGSGYLLSSASSTAHLYRLQIGWMNPQVEEC